MVGPHILFVANIGWIAIGKDVIGAHYEIIVKYSNPRLRFSSPNYSWFMQYMKSDNGESGITQLPLGTNSSYTSGKLIYCVIQLSSLIQLLSFACSWFGLCL
jgi:hypothetical protein